MVIIGKLKTIVALESLKGIVKRAEPCKCDILLVSKIP